nr:DUF4405 domain-containing protein [Harryflintia acetispora]
MITDLGLTVCLICLMTYELIGQSAHEWIGAGMFALFLLHHALNWNWCRNLLKGTYTAYRILQTVLVFLILFSMLGSMASGIVLSRHVFSFLPISGGRSWARILHMLCAYWGFVLMSLHLGLHWGMMMGVARRLIKKSEKSKSWLIRFPAFLIAGYGAFAFFHRGIGSYMLLKNTFVFFDFEEPLLFFLLDYIAVMGLFILIGYYLSEALKKLRAVKTRRRLYETAAACTAPCSSARLSRLFRSKGSN